MTGANEAAGRTDTVNGAFFQSGGTVAGQAGNITLSGTNYKAADTFAAAKSP